MPLQYDIMTKIWQEWQENCSHAGVQSSSSEWQCDNEWQYNNGEAIVCIAYICLRHESPLSWWDDGLIRWFCDISRMSVQCTRVQCTLFMLSWVRQAVTSQMLWPYDMIRASEYDDRMFWYDDAKIWRHDVIQAAREQAEKKFILETWCFFRPPASKERRK